MKCFALSLLLVLPGAYEVHAQNIDVLTAHKWKARDTIYSDKNPSGRLVVEQYIDSVVINAVSSTYRARGKTIVFSPEKNYTSFYSITGKIISQSKKVIISYEEHSYEKTVAGEKLCPTMGKLRLYAGSTPGSYLLKGEMVELCGHSLQPYVFFSEEREP